MTLIILSVTLVAALLYFSSKDKSEYEEKPIYHNRGDSYNMTEELPSGISLTSNYMNGSEFYWYESKMSDEIFYFHTEEEAIQHRREERLKKLLER